MESARIFTSTLAMYHNLSTSMGDIPSFLLEGNKDVVLLIFPSVFGVDSDIEDIARHFFAKGYSVLAVDPFWNVEPGPLGHSIADVEQALYRMRQLPFDEACHQAHAFSVAARNVASRVVALGVGYGGKLAFSTLSRGGVEAVSIWHCSGLGRMLDLIPTIKGPLELHYGGLDATTPAIEREVLQSFFTEHDSFSIQLYPEGKHNFSLASGSNFQPSLYQILMSSLDRLLINQLEML